MQNNDIKSSSLSPGGAACAAPTPAIPNLEPLSIAQIASVIRRDWKNVYFGAKPYLAAMSCMDKVSDTFGADSPGEPVLYFLSNAQTWRGPVAKAVKAELNKRLKAMRGR